MKLRPRWRLREQDSTPVIERQVHFSDQEAVPVTEEAATAQVDESGTRSTVAIVQPTSTRRRGRPRTQETLVRDEIVLTTLRERAMTRAELQARLSVSGSLVYISLCRLKAAGRVRRESDNGTRNVWHVVGD